MTTITVEGANIILNGLSLEEILNRVYSKGKEDALKQDIGDKVTFIALSGEMLANGRKISVRTLTAKARNAGVKIFKFDGNKNAILRKDIKHFINF